MTKLTFKIIVVALTLSVFFLNSTLAYAQKTRIKALEKRVSKLEARCFGGLQSHLREEVVDCSAAGDCANAGACGCFDAGVTVHEDICCSCGYYPSGCLTDYWLDAANENKKIPPKEIYEFPPKGPL